MNMMILQDRTVISSKLLPMLHQVNAFDRLESIFHQAKFRMTPLIAIQSLKTRSRKMEPFQLLSRLQTRQQSSKS